LIPFIGEMSAPSSKDKALAFTRRQKKISQDINCLPALTK
jgi:hypothetical protein